MTDPGLLWERWPEIDGILAAALEIPAADRLALVDRAIPEPGPFRDLVRRMVQRLDRADPRVSGPARRLMVGAFGSAEDRDATDLAAGTRVGPFVLAERLARGGMATVYAADRADGTYEQRVALKIIRRGLDTDDLIRRFRTERQVLSRLTHPNIARLLDGGALPDGRPWLAVELIRGESITEFADGRRLSIRERLALFLGVADAVHAAHRQLVVHRDIKPSNVLVDHEGRVKLLDFGIAKLLDDDTEHTGLGNRPLTPAYATPEQCSGDRITTATDVYQLGLLLRELLTGCRPASDPAADHHASRPSRLATLEIPGTATAAARARLRVHAPGRLARTLAGDLDLIVAKALRPDPEERYAGAGELAADVRNHLRGEPVLAHPESVRYRAAKFVSRNRWSVIAVVVGTVSLGGYAVTVSIQNQRVAVARDRAAREAQKAAEVSEFMVSLFDAADPNASAGQARSAEELLRDGARRLREDAVSDPGVQAAMLTAIGRSFARLGDTREAEVELTMAVEAHRAAQPPDPVAQAAAIKELALVVYDRDAGRAVELFEEARRMATAALGPDDPFVASILVDYSVALSRTRPRDPAIDSMLARAVRLLRTAPGDQREALANALTVWARGRPPAEAIPRMREALELRRAIRPEVHAEIASSLSDLALAVESTDPLAADTLLTRAVAIFKQLNGTHGALVLTAMNNLAAVRRDRGAYTQALPLYREVLALRRQYYPEHQRSLAFTLYGLGVVLTETGHAAEAEARLREAATILGRDTPRSALIVITQGALARAQEQQGHPLIAAGTLRTALDGPNVSGLSPAQHAGLLRQLITLYEEGDQAAAARPYRERLAQIEASVVDSSAT